MKLKRKVLKGQPKAKSTVSPLSWQDELKPAKKHKNSWVRLVSGHPVKVHQLYSHLSREASDKWELEMHRIDGSTAGIWVRYTP